MRHFKHMVKCLNKSGLAIVDQSNETTLGVKRIIDPKDKKAMTIVDDLLSKCIPFIFHHKLIGCSDDVFSLSQEDIQRKSVYCETNYIDPPFPIFSAEFSGGYCMTSIKSNVAHYLHCMLVCDMKSYQSSDKIIEHLTNGAMKDDQFFMMAFASQSNLFDCKPFICGFTNNGHYQTSFLLDKLNRHHAGVIESPCKISYPKPHNPKKKDHMTKDKVFIVSDKRYTASVDPMFRDVKWNHRWHVRGHWRRVNGIGKNREGEYCEERRTWVRHTTKGQNVLPLVKKEYIVC